MAHITGRIGVGFSVHRLTLGKKTIEFNECFINEKMTYGIDIGSIDLVGQVYLIYVSSSVLLEEGYKILPISIVFNGVKGATSLFDSKEVSALIQKFNMYITIKFPEYSIKGDLYVVNDVDKIFHKIT